MRLLILQKSKKKKKDREEGNDSRKLDTWHKSQTHNETNETQ